MTFNELFEHIKTRLTQYGFSITLDEIHCDSPIEVYDEFSDMYDVFALGIRGITFKIGQSQFTINTKRNEHFICSAILIILLELNLFHWYVKLQYNLEKRIDMFCYSFNNLLKYAIMWDNMKAVKNILTIDFNPICREDPEIFKTLSIDMVVRVLSKGYKFYDYTESATTTYERRELKNFGVSLDIIDGLIKTSPPEYAAMLLRFRKEHFESKEGELSL